MASIESEVALLGTGVKSVSGTASLSVGHDMRATGVRWDWHFNPPTVDETPPAYARARGLLRRVKLATGVTVLKQDGFYRQVREPEGEAIDTADIAYLGGRDYPVTEQEALELQAAGYGSFLSTREHR